MPTIHHIVVPVDLGDASDAALAYARMLAIRFNASLTAKAIVDYAAQCGASLIVMGTHGRRGLAHAVLGSVAGQVLRGARCPVLVVRQPQEPVHLNVMAAVASMR